MSRPRKGKAAPASARGPSVDADEPQAGCYRIHLRRDGPPVALKIWHGPPLDPVTGATLDRGHRWLARLNGLEIVPVERVWPECAKQRITELEHDRLAELSRTLDPSSPYYDPQRPIDPLTVPPPFKGVDDA